MSGTDNILPFTKEGRLDELPINDGELVRLFETLRSRLTAYLGYRLGSASEAQDALQVVFMRMWQRRTDLRPENLRALAFVTARNYATDRIRQQMRQRAMFNDGADLPDDQQAGDDAPGADRILNARQELQLISRIVRELPEKCRLAFIRCKFEEAEYAEVANELGITESMVRKYVLRGMAHCARRFAEMEGWQ